MAVRDGEVVAWRWTGGALGDGVRVVGHGGDVGAYSAELALVPEQHLGFFVTANAVDHEFRHAVVDGLLDLLVDPAPVFGLRF